MNQHEINEAFEALVAGRPHRWKQVLQGIHDGSITYSTTTRGLTIHSKHATTLSAALNDLRHANGNPTLSQIAEYGHISSSTLSRMFTGERGVAWPTVKVVIEYLGGDPADYERLWEEDHERRRHNS